MFYAGFVESCEDEGFVLRYVDPGGQPSAKAQTAWFDYGEVDWVEHGTDYLTGLARLHAVADKFKGITRGRFCKSPRSVSATLRSSLENQSVCRVEFSDGDYDEGVVVGLDRYWVRIQLVSDSGAKCGQKVVRRDTIERIRAGGLLEVGLTYLMGKE